MLEYVTMGRRTRIEFPGAFYHIISRGNNRRIIYKDEQDFKYFLKSLRMRKERDNFKLYAYMLMNNHFHLLLETKEIKLSMIMQRLLTRYSCYFNKKYKTVGHLFQGRYKAILCRKDNYLLELIRYIHLNPARAGIVQRLSDWLWSSHQIYLGKTDSGLVNTEFVLKILDENLLRAQNKYCEFIKQKVTDSHRNDFYPLDSCLGDGEFFSELEKKTGEIRNNEKRKIRTELSNLAEYICKIYNIDRTDLGSYKKTKDVVEPRRMFIYIAITYCGYTGVETAKFLNLDRSAISHIYRHIENEIQENETICEKLKQILQKYE